MATTNLFAGLNQETTQQAVLSALGPLATQATQAQVLTALTTGVVHTDLANILTKLSGDPATQAGLTAILNKLPSTPATDTPHTTTSASPAVAGGGLTAGQAASDAQLLNAILNQQGSTSGLPHTDAVAIKSSVDAVTSKLVTSPALDSSLQSILTKLSGDPATQTTLAAVLAKLPGSPALDSSLQSILTKLSGDPATQTTLAAVLAKLTNDPSTATNQTSEITALGNILTALGTGSASGLAKLEDTPRISGDRGIGVFGVRGLSTPAVRTDTPGDYGFVQIDAEGRLVMLNGSVPENTFQGVVQTTTAATTALRAASTTGLRNFITDLEIVQQTATANNISILDGSTIIARYALPATIGASLTISRRTPIRGSTNTALNVTTSAASTVNFNFGGYLGV